jgi:prevent-host-death family protein
MTVSRIAFMGKEYWTVAEAKAKLSEVLRRVREEGPQRIGVDDACIVITQEQWEEVQRPSPKLGAWLTQNMPTIDDLALPDRKDPHRPSPFDEVA